MLLLLRLLLRQDRQLLEALDNAQRATKEAQRTSLDTMRDTLDLAIAFRLSYERPEVDLRDELDGVIRTLHDSVAVLEELIV